LPVTLFMVGISLSLAARGVEAWPRYKLDLV
jgi:hypothetical protein